ncbi:fibrous sheath-interacting protein 2-like isoform X2 [Alligator mississippiensis]|uniref:fibrous sheath-interacting protein 2-like isoform X2 n=1 Tax=Alligator mississippiensis TaxID=8496 RepID=UPI0028774CFF|nr:fibrous sheath-interacting protein 2-like isoform X2 [Alligator mississippiensis]
MDGQRNRQSKRTRHMLHKAMKKNKTKYITDEVTNIMTWFVSEVTGIIYPAIIQYEGRKIAERDRGDHEGNAKNFVFTDRNRAPSISPGCMRRGRRSKITPLLSQQAPSQSPTRRHLARKPFFPSLRKVFPKEEVAMQGACSKPLTTCTIEPQTLQSQTSIYADAFFRETYDELISKLVLSQIPHIQDIPIPGSNPSCITTAGTDSILNKLSKHQATNLQPSEDQGLSPDIDTLTAKIIHTSLSDLRQERASQVSVYADMQDNNSIYADAFFRERYDELISKSVLSEIPHIQDIPVPGSNPSCIATAGADSILNKLSKHQATNLQPSEDQGLSPDIDTLTAKIIHTSLSDLMQERASKVSVSADMQDKNSVPAESFGGLIRRKINGCQQEKAKAPSSVPNNPQEPGEIDAEKLLEAPTKSNARGHSPTPSILGVCHRVLEDLISGLLSNILPATASTSSSPENKMDFAEFDLIHMKIISKVKAKISEDENSSSQHTEQPHSRVEDMIQTIADSVYNKLLTQFQSRLNMQNCLRNGCMVISEALCDLVVQEVSGHPLQSSLSEELLLHHCAEADEIAEKVTVGNGTEPLHNPNSLSSYLSKIAPLIIEKLEANLMSTLSSLFPFADLDTEKMLLLNGATRKILHALQAVLSQHQMNMNKHINENEFLGTEDRQAMGDILHLACTSTGDHSGSDIFVCGNLTDKTDILANRIAASIAKEVAKPEFQGSSEGETLPVSASTTEAVRIVEKSPADFGRIETMPKPFNPPILVVPVTFVEEVLSRFLAKVLSSTDGTSPNCRRHLSRSKVTEIVEDLKEAMEQGLSKHQIRLVAATNERFPPERDDAINEVVLSVSRNMLQKSGSEQELYDDITGFDSFFPQEMVTVIIEELSQCPFLQAVSDSPATPSQSAMNPGRIADRVLSQVSISDELKTWSCEETIPGSEDASSMSEAQRNDNSYSSRGSTGQPVVRPGELETLAAGASQNEQLSPTSEDMDDDTAAAPKQGSLFFIKMPNALSRVHSFLSRCLPHRRRLRKVSPEITPTH